MTKSDLPQGTLDLLILKVVALGPVHGYAIAQRLQQVSARRGAGSAGLALSGAAPAREPRPSGGGLKNTETGREAKFYRLTRKGRAQLNTGPRAGSD